MRLALLLAGLAGCATPQFVPRVAPGVQLATITVTSPTIADGGQIPIDHTCDGKDLIPELVLSSPPEGTRSLVLLVDDPDAPGGVFTHLIAFNLSPDVRKIPSEPELSALGPDVRTGTNDFHAVRYSGPCPPKGEQHRYRFRILALDTMLKLDEASTKSQLDRAIDAHVLGEGILTAAFGH